ncbi:MAG: 5'-nucleotidase [Candidatus Omnitrophota bacterium]|jgi:5'-nucleotidase
MKHILLTNDDGIYAPGLAALHKELKKFAKVTVVAPDGERSSISHAITLKDPLRIQQVTLNSFKGHAINGYPADCVKIACGVILKDSKPDIVISGINHGQNDGCSVIYSGTVAGAREGALMGIPSIATSLATFDKANFTTAAKMTAKIVKKIDKFNLPNATFLNVNVPNLETSQIKGFRVVKQGSIPIHGKFIKKKDQYGHEYYWMTGQHPIHKNDNEYDTYAMHNGYVTIVPIQCDGTDYDFLQKTKNLKI